MGRSQTIEGELYYSPNAVADVTLNLDASPFNNNPFIKKTDTDSVKTYEDFQIPRRWTQQFGWISFIPTVPSVQRRGASILMELATRPSIERFSNAKGDFLGYGIADSCRWPQLENDLFKAVVTLTKKYHIPCVLPAMPHTYGYRNKYPSRGVLMTKIALSREWFMVWLGALGYAVAWLFNPSDRTERMRSGYPDWRTALEMVGLPPSWMDEILHSSVCCFHPSVSRAGCVLDVLNPVGGQPTLEWLIGHGIPVWYRWGRLEKERASYDIQFARLAPPPERTAPVETASVVAADPGADIAMEPAGEDVQAPSLICAATESPPSQAKALKTQSPHSGASSTEEQAEGSTPNAGASLQAEQTPIYSPQVPEWVIFFEERRLKDEALKATATPEVLGVWSDRAKAPATSSAKVFVWERSDDEAILYTRNPISAKWRGETLDLFSTSQKRYDPIRKEWDCCSEFGEPDDDSDDESMADTSPGDPTYATPFTTTLAAPAGAILSSLQETDSRPSEMMDTTTTTMIHAVQDHFRSHHGFCNPIGGTWSSTSTNPRHTPYVMQLANVSHDSNSDEVEMFAQTVTFSALHCFFEAVANLREPPAEIWDINESCPQFVRTSPRFATVKRVPIPNHTATTARESYKSTKSFYYLITPRNPLERWTLATLSAAAALMVCQLPRGSSEHDTAYHLARQGIPFRIFHPRQALVPRHPRSPIQHTIPMRPPNHTFTKADYDAYVTMRTLLLGQSHMQAALKRGGMSWRLAITTLGLNGVTDKPSLYNEFQDIMIGNTWWLDDILTEAELDLLCGLYECFAGNGRDRALKSWWPLVRYFEKEECRYNHGYWSEKNEDWYTRRLREIESGSAAPLTYTEWKSKLHGTKPIRNFLSYVEKRSSDAIV
ncbi:hypothetical protein FA13DRAFT_1708285 [Coprinellus micaceus]|uniref:Uncharacterized protein n=1 Tax=Coprinellus micaceus TaxID=71717 RepID=A0A4Y7TH44_COPMI|nr:hypothetical protein FA13DRAFT_1708285 [Coprinellus micaceus]